MTPTTTVELAHHVVVVTDDAGNYRAECTCDWASDWYEDDDLAAGNAGFDHLQVAVGPPDAMDRLMSNLLDLQEDLAAVVIWLADHWSSGLPTPYPSIAPYGQEDTIALAVQCTKGLDQLNQVAALLGEAVTPDPTRDPDDGRHYSCARRSFGRVTVTAWAYS